MSLLDLYPSGVTRLGAQSLPIRARYYPDWQRSPRAHTFCHSMLRHCSILVLLFGALLPPISAAQETNVEVLQRLAVECLGNVPTSTGSLQLVTGEEAPYLRSALVNHWRQQDIAVFLPDTSQSRNIGRLQYDVDAAGVSYDRASNGRVQREVTLALHYTLADGTGRVMVEDVCRESSSDTIDRARLAAVESEVYPEANAPPPPAGWLRRYVEPAVLTAATAVGVYLFFTLRSQAEEE